MVVRLSFFSNLRQPASSMKLMGPSSGYACMSVQYFFLCLQVVLLDSVRELFITAVKVPRTNRELFGWYKKSVDPESDSVEFCTFRCSSFISKEFRSYTLTSVP